MRKQKYNDDLIVLGERIRQYRKIKGWAQDKLAFEASLDRSYIGSIERGERNVTFVALCKITSALNIDISALTKDLPAHKGGQNA